jgi:protein-S-isoprenylcysteine O-methyltransferase Ste14
MTHVTEWFSTDLSRRIFALCYAMSAFVGTWVFFACFIIFLGNFPHRSDPWFWPSVDIGPEAAPSFAVAWNFGLVCLFAAQHSVMARPGFKRILTAYLPSGLERATYVHAANLAGFLLILMWQPIPSRLWSVENEFLESAIWLGFASGWLILFAGAFSINLFELLGLRQAVAMVAGQQAAPLRLKTEGIYRYLSHPMYVGVLMGLWMTPVMSVGHALLAAQLTAYILIGTHYERRDLRRNFGTVYDAWCQLPVSAHPHAPAARLVTVDEPLPPRMQQLLTQLAADECRAEGR